MQRDRPAEERRDDDDARGGETAKSDDQVGRLGADDAGAAPEGRRQLPEETKEPDRMERKRRARDGLEPQLPVFFDQARVDLLPADEQGGLVPAGDEPFRQRDTRREVSARAAAGDEKPAHSARPFPPPPAAGPAFMP